MGDSDFKGNHAMGHRRIRLYQDDHWSESIGIKLTVGKTGGEGFI